MITLFLMTKKGYSVLRGIIDAGYSSVIDMVVLSRDESMQNDYFDDLVALCVENNITCTDNKNISTTSAYAIAVSWRWMINLSTTKLIVLHDSILPKYRGFSPLINMLINGEKKIGVTALFASSEYDRGEIIDQRSIDITYPIKIFDAINVLSDLYVDLVNMIIKKCTQNEMILATPQNEGDATYSLWRNEEDYIINWENDAEYNKRFIDSLGFPFNGAKTFMNNDSVRIHNSSVLEDVHVENRVAGKIIFLSNGFPVVVCGKGLLKITEMTDNAGNSLIPFKKMRVKFSNLTVS